MSEAATRRITREDNGVVVMSNGVARAFFASSTARALRIELPAEDNTA